MRIEVERPDIVLSRSLYTATISFVVFCFINKTTLVCTLSNALRRQESMRVFMWLLLVNSSMNYETNCNIDSFPSNKFLSVDTTTLTVCVSRPCVLSSHYSPSQFLVVILDKLKKRNISICRNFWQQIVGTSAAFFEPPMWVTSHTDTCHCDPFSMQRLSTDKILYIFYYTTTTCFSNSYDISFFKFKETKLMTFTTSTNYALVN